VHYAYVNIQHGFRSNMPDGVPMVIWGRTPPRFSCARYDNDDPRHPRGDVHMQLIFIRRNAFVRARATGMHTSAHRPLLPVSWTTVSLFPRLSHLSPPSPPPPALSRAARVHRRNSKLENGRPRTSEINWSLSGERWRGWGCSDRAQKEENASVGSTGGRKEQGGKSGGGGGELENEISGEKERSVEQEGADDAREGGPIAELGATSRRLAMHDRPTGPSW